MRKVVFIMIVALASLTAGAQLKVDFGSYAIGVTGNYSLGSNYSNPGVGINLQRFMRNSETFRASVYVNHFFKTQGVSMWNAGIDMHYVLPLSKTVGLYPLLGLGSYAIKLPDETYEVNGEVIYESDELFSELDIHLRAGVGCEYYVKPEIKIFGELKYSFGNYFRRPMCSIGVAYVW